MDVPFLSSGAMSRAHYALVSKVESATSAPMADQYLLEEVENVRDRLSRPISARQTKECLIMLLYCSMNCTVPLPDLEFALPHALSLAEAGKSVQYRRIGYLYCVDMMPKSHELQLMLVNTLRKDLEAREVSRICLALDVLIQDPSEDVVPAVRDRLQDLLSHNSLHVRRRALLAFRTLSVFDTDIMKDVVQKMRQRLEDPDLTVASAALTVSMRLLEVGLVSPEKLRPVLFKRLRDAWQDREDVSKHWLLIKILQVLRAVKPSAKAVSLLMEIIRASSQHNFANVVLHQCFQVLSTTEVDILIEAQASTGVQLLDSVRHLLISEDPNDVYLFVSCLDNLDAALWAGTTPEIPSALEAWEVERIMQLLNSPDPSLRRTTLKVLRTVDVGIIEAYSAQLLQASGALSGLQEQEEATQRLLEVINLLYAESGEAYAQHLKTATRAVEGALSNAKPRVIQTAVEDVLTKFRDAGTEFRAGCTGVLVASLDDSDSDEKIGPTMAVILSAVLCEYLDLSPLPPTRVLQGLAHLLAMQSVAIQDAILLAMIRIAASCDEVPENVLGTVGKVREAGGRHIKRRCDQFIRLSTSKDSLKTVMSRAKSLSLPDFLAALEGYEANPIELHGAAQETDGPRALSPDRPSSRASSYASHTPGKLRYKAYDAPKTTGRLRSHHNDSAAHSDSGSSRFIGQSSDIDDTLSRTLTAGDLAIVSGQMELEDFSKRSPKADASLLQAIQAVKSLNLNQTEPAGAADLIALDSPFIDPSAETRPSKVTDADFEAVWNKLQHANLRGWCDSPVDVVVRRLQAMQRKMRVTPADQTPFKGDLKILIPSENAVAADNEGLALLRLREGEEESCLWHLRCEDGNLRASIRTLLTDA